jgi:hypothetical protein
MQLLMATIDSEPMTERLKPEFPSQGWKQILTARKEMLDSYDKARDQARSHEVETYHGRVAEAKCREWLAGFLPKRFGVTSGYIVSPGLGSTEKTPHFDVIIYDALEAPVLWIEDNPDSSASGRSMAVPVEHIGAVLEVKSHFSASNVRASIEHLRDLAPVMKALDAPDQQYKLHLPPCFRCGMIFFELRVEDANSQTAIDAVIDGVGLRGFFGGMILRGETHTLPETARISLARSEEPISGLLPGTPLLKSGLSNTVQVADKVHLGSMILWSESAFAQFAFDLLAMLQGTYRPGYVSSWYGLGGTFAEPM